MTGATDQPAQPHEDPVALLRAAADRLDSPEASWLMLMGRTWALPPRARRPLASLLHREANGLEATLPAWRRAHLSPGFDQEPMVDRPHDIPKLVETHFGEALEFARLILPGGATGSGATERGAAAAMADEPRGAGTGRGSGDSVALERRTAARTATHSPIKAQDTGNGFGDPDGLGVTTGGEGQ